MRQTNAQLIEAFIKGAYSGEAGNLSIRKGDLFSYNMRIGTWDTHSNLLVSVASPTATTTKHIKLLKSMIPIKAMERGLQNTHR